MKDIYKLNLERKPITAEPDTRTNLLVIPHIRVGQVFTTQVEPRIGDGGVPSFHKYVVTGFGPEGVSMLSGGLRVEAD